MHLKKAILFLLLGVAMTIAGCDKEPVADTEIASSSEVEVSLEESEQTEITEEVASEEEEQQSEESAADKEQAIPEVKLIQGYVENPDEEGNLREIGSYAPVASFWLRIDGENKELVRTDGDLSQEMAEAIKSLDMSDLDLSKRGYDGVTESIQIGEQRYNVIFVTELTDDMLPSYTFPEGWDYQFGAPRIGSFMDWVGDSAGAEPVENGDYIGYADRLSGGCSTFCACGHFYLRKSVSSGLNYEKHGAKQLDDYVRDAWAEGVAGPGIGEFFEFTSLYMGGGEPVFSYNEMCIVNGYAKNEQTWQENNRVKSLKLYFEDEYMGIITLEDTMQPQYIDLSPVNMKVGNGCEANFRFEIAEVYSGTKYDDTCISGVVLEFEGREH